MLFTIYEWMDTMQTAPFVLWKYATEDYTSLIPHEKLAFSQWIRGNVAKPPKKSA